MASFKDLEFEWSMLCQDSTKWSSEDLQLAAELGKTLLERNKELETSLKQHQNIIDDKRQEIEYLRKQTVALREVNDSRLRIYEQLEVSIQDLERANHRLALESSSDKKHLKNLTANIESLELKCEELQGTIDDLNLQIDSYKRRLLETPTEPVVITKVVNLRHVEYDETDNSNLSRSPKKEKETKCKNTKTETPVRESQKPLVESTPNPAKAEKDDPEDANEQLTHLTAQLRETQTLLVKEQRRVTELEEHLASMVQQNQSLEKQLVHIHLKDEEAKSMHEELMMLEEVRQGQLCIRCLRTIDSPRTGDNMSCLGDEAEDDDSSMLEALINNSTYRSSFSMDIQDVPHKSPGQESNLYRDLIEKYEALLEVQRTQSLRNQKSNNLSLQEEMQMSSNFNSVKDTDDESGHGDSLQPEQQNNKKHHKSRTPTDFSEAETSSSGFSDETSNKATQTDERPGSFLCTIADGEDCKFSIYDDASPVDSRFRNRPEYRELFSEIFTVLKKAAENKDEGEELPLLDDLTLKKKVPIVPSVTALNEEILDFSDTQSVLSSTMSEMSTSQIDTTTVIENVENNEPKTKDNKDEPVLTPYMRPSLEYLQVSVNVRKRSSSRRKKQLAERSGSPATPILGSPKITYSNRQSAGRRRREIKAPLTDLNNSWTGNTLHFFSRSTSSPTPSLNSGRSCIYENSLEYKPSTASQDLNKLKRLDLSYAEVLRNADNKKREREAAARQRRKP